jgi:hypothetical protein
MVSKASTLCAKSASADCSALLGIYKLAGVTVVDTTASG